MRPLLLDMTQEDPSKRPKVNEVIQRFPEVRASLSESQLRSRVVDTRTIYPLFSGLGFKVQTEKAEACSQREGICTKKAVPF